jgi:pyruvate kinase
MDICTLRSSIEERLDRRMPILWGKIETVRGVENLCEICQVVDAVLIGRGDLWVEAGTLESPELQSKILQTARLQETDCYVATQVLESMRNSPVPTRSELRDIYTSIQEGARGFMLTAETSVGKYPLEAIRVLRKMLDRYAPPRETPNRNSMITTSQEVTEP